MVVLRRDVLRECSHLLDADAGVGAEFDPDGADAGGRRVRLRGRGWGGVFFEHGGRGAGGEGHSFAAGGEEVLAGLVGWGGVEGFEGVGSLRAAVGVGVCVAKFIERDSDFFFSQFVALGWTCQYQGESGD